MFRTKCATISPTWTLSCQRSNDLCCPSPGLCPVWGKRIAPPAAADSAFGAPLYRGFFAFIGEPVQSGGSANPARAGELIR
jgi:hypothetical protein